MLYFVNMSNQLLKKYKLLFGENAPIPPEHIMETLVEMKEDGSFNEKLKTIRENYPKIKKIYKEETGDDLKPNSSIFDIDFRNKKK